MIDPCCLCHATVFQPWYWLAGVMEVKRSLQPCCPQGLTDIHSPPQANLYPTVGLQTPGEIVDANFGQQPFLFDIEDYMREWRAKVQGTVHGFPISARLGEWQAVLQK